MSTSAGGGSASIEQPDYWWYRARTELLRVTLEKYVGRPRRVLDVGSADGPSVRWLRGHGDHVSLDVDPRGLTAGGVCGSALALPFADRTFDVVAAFDVVEHCDPEGVALGELYRVLTPGGRLLMSVPAYEWAWTSFDEENGHHRRYTRARARDAAEAAGFVVDRSTYAFTGVFPLFALQRLVTRVKEGRRSRGSAAPADVVSLPQVSPAMDRLLMGLSKVDLRLLPSRDLPFGSSVLLALHRPAD